MNVEFFIAKRIHSDKKGGKQISRPGIRIAVAGIALGLAVMILAVAIVIGFKQEIRGKVIGFGSHIRISSFESNYSYETQPIVVTDELINEIMKNPEVVRAERFATKPGIIKTDTDFLGVILKGIDKDYDLSFFEKNLIEGKMLTIPDTLTNDVLISENIANKLHLSLGDGFLTYFVQENVRMRKFNIVGIYQTNFTEYDEIFLLADMRHIQRLNNWDSLQVSGIEILVKDYNRVDEIAEDIFYDLNDEQAGSFYVETIRDLNPQIFNWLDLLDMNVWIILGLMLAVSGFTMISGLLILILERTNMIGILKALGAKDFSIRKVFLYLSSFLVLRGMLYGNIIALVICFIQYYFHVFTLDLTIYYIDTVPIHLNVLYIILLNIMTLLISMLILILPSYLIARINPARSIRFE
ncbi:MAG: ABC transporter permease [Candidatus Azobacteroides sp.]|nr:ABC transporter permease [Candidatus Azobacteroides sp.]